MKLITRIQRIPTKNGRIKLYILRPKDQQQPLPGILWIHGGGYLTGFAAMVHVSIGKMLAEKYGAVVVSPGYRLSWQDRYPAAVDDFYAALEYMYGQAEELMIDRSRIIVGG